MRVKEELESKKAKQLHGKQHDKVDAMDVDADVDVDVDTVKDEDDVKKEREDEAAKTKAKRSRYVLVLRVAWVEICIVRVVFFICQDGLPSLCGGVFFTGMWRHGRY